MEQGGVYTGAMGYISFNGDCDFNIIRTTLYHNSTYYLGVGGITYESEEKFELDETWQKAKAIIDALL